MEGQVICDTRITTWDVSVLVILRNFIVVGILLGFFGFIENFCEIEDD